MSLVNLLKKTCRKTLFTTPSHAQGFFIFHKLRNFYKYDISETEAHDPETALSKAEAKATKMYGTKSTSFLTNGSTSGIIGAVLSCVKSGEKVLLWKNAHPCHLNAVKLAGGIPVFYDLEKIEEWDIYDKTTPEIIEKYLKDRGIKAVLVTSPSYEGIVSPIREIKKVCEKYGAYLIVDEAHGALYPFSENLPKSSVKIADFTIQSLHKTAGGLNPTALLHCNCEVDVKPALRMINTTSPSYPLLASIEKNINYLNSKKGRREIETLISEIKALKEECGNCEFFGDDATKILVKHPNHTGEELSEILYDKYNIEDERTNTKSTMLLCGIGTNKAKLTRLKQALKGIK